MRDSDKNRVNVYLNEDVLAQIDEFAKKNGISRSGAISVLCIQSIQSNKSIDVIAKFQDLLKQEEKKIAEKTG